MLLLINTIFTQNNHPALIVKALDFDTILSTGGIT